MIYLLFLNKPENELKKVQVYRKKKCITEPLKRKPIYSKRQSFFSYQKKKAENSQSRKKSVKCTFQISAFLGHNLN